MVATSMGVMPWIDQWRLGDMLDTHCALLFLFFVSFLNPKPFSYLALVLRPQPHSCCHAVLSMLLERAAGPLTDL